MTLLDDLTATHWHVSRAARDGVPPHRRLEIAVMDNDKIRTLLDRLDTARSRARSFGINDDERGRGDLDSERAAALRASADVMLDHLVAGWATTLDELPVLAADASATIRTLMARIADLEAKAVRP